MTDDAPLIRTIDLKQHFPLRAGLLGRAKLTVKAVDGITIDIPRRSVLGLVGESGSGKSTFGRAVMGLEKPTSGTLEFDGIDMAQASPDQTKALRRRMQMVFQDPFSSLNPRMSVAETLGVPLRFHELELGPAGRRDRAAEMMERVGLPSAYIDRFPHEFSGGQRQRIGIARALIMEPDFVVCDEPISALDVSVQAQVVNLLNDLKTSMGLTMLFIAHDLSMVRYISDRMAVMYLGSLVEIGKASDVYFDPRHPYTEVLIASNPEPDPATERQRASTAIRGEIPSPVNVPAGCRFAGRCPKVMPVCHEQTPQLLPLLDEDRLVACHLYHQ